jgi:hypothetical protein
MPRRFRLTTAQFLRLFVVGSHRGDMLIAEREDPRLDLLALDIVGCVLEFVLDHAPLGEDVPYVSIRHDGFLDTLSEREVRSIVCPL